MPASPSRRTAPPALPRERWDSHPNYPEHALLLGSHEGFRRYSAHLIDAAEAGRSIGDISARFYHWMAAMRGHEGYEEGKLYPFLRHRFAVDTSTMQAGHDALHGKQHDVEARLLRVPLEPALDFEDARTDLVTGLRAYDATLRAHLELEEDTVIPALLALCRDEFRTYYASSIRALLAQDTD